MSLPPRVAAVVCALLLAGSSHAGDPPASNNAEAAGAARSRAERLRSLGYLDYAPETRADGMRQGVIHFDPVRAQPGHNLVVSSRECAARLIDMSGAVLFTWRQPGCERWWSAEWLRNGDLIVSGRLPTAPRERGGRFVARITASGQLRWLRMMKAHHQIDWTPQEEVLVMSESLVEAQLFDRTGLTVGRDIRIHENPLHWLDGDGGPVESLSLFEAVTTGDTDFDFVEIDSMREAPRHIGVFHSNSAYAMDQPGLAGADALHASDNVLVTSRNQDRIFIVSRSTRSLVWQWGRGELSRPHDGTWLSNGNLLVFDNGVAREASRVLEVDPRQERIVWQYPDARGEPFYSPARGMAQRLDNGNTLIVVSHTGTAFETTPTGEIVWRYLNPPLGGDRRRPTLVSLRRYPEEWSPPDSLGSLRNGRHTGE